MKKLLIILILFGVLSLTLPSVLGAACGVTPTDSCYQDISATWGRSTLQLNGSATGVVNVNGSNIVVNCNFTTFRGNNTAGLVGLNIQTVQNVTFVNCSFTNYTMGVRVRTANNTVLNNVNISGGTLGYYLSTAGQNTTVINSYAEKWNNSAFYVESPYSNATLKDSIVTLSNRSAYFETNYNTVSGGRIYNNSIGVYSTSANNTIVENVTFGNTTYATIWIVQGWNARVLNNYIKEPANETHAAIYFQTLGSNPDVRYNYISGKAYGIRLLGTHPGANLSYNNITLTNITAIELSNLSNQSDIRGNLIIDNLYNGITWYSWHNLIHDNVVTNFGHHGIDTHNDLRRILAGNTSIYQNTVSQTATTYSGAAGPGIYVAFSNGTRVFNNGLYNLYTSGTTQLSRGIAVEGGNNATGTRVYNNTLSGISANCFLDTSNDTRWEDNSVTGCERASILVATNAFTKTVPSPVIIHNYDDSGTFSVNTTTQAGTTTYTVLFTPGSNTRQQFSTNVSVNMTLSGLVYPYNDIYNVTGGYYLRNSSPSFTTFELLMGPGDVFTIGSISAASQARVGCTNTMTTTIAALVLIGILVLVAAIGAIMTVLSNFDPAVLMGAIVSFVGLAILLFVGYNIVGSVFTAVC